MDWERGAEEMDEEFRQGECVEVELSGDEMPPDSGDEGFEDENEEIGIIGENELYGEDASDGVDDSLASVSLKDSVLSVSICPTDRKVILTGGQDDMAVLWSVEESSSGLRCVERFRLTGHTDSVVQVAFSHDGAYAATGSYDCTVRIWNPSTGALVQSLEGPSKEIEWILWHPKGHAILAGSNDTMCWMWWAPTGKVMQIFAGHASGVTCGCWALGGKMVVTGSEDKSVIVWNPRAASPDKHVRQVHDNSIISICSHPESPIVVTGSIDGVAKVIQIETGKALATLSGHVDSVEAVKFNNPTGGILLLATGSMDGKIYVWDAKTFDKRCSLKEHFENGGIVTFRWLPPGPYGSWLTTCSTDCTLRLFNALSGECVRTLRGHRETVLDLDISLAEANTHPQLIVASGSEDKTLKLFVVALWTGGQQPEASGSAFGMAPLSAAPSAPSAPTSAPGVPAEEPVSPSRLPV